MNIAEVIQYTNLTNKQKTSCILKLEDIVVFDIFFYLCFIKLKNTFFYHRNYHAKSVGKNRCQLI